MKKILFLALFALPISISAMEGDEMEISEDLNRVVVAPPEDSDRDLEEQMAVVTLDEMPRPAPGAGVEESMNLFASLGNDTDDDTDEDFGDLLRPRRRQEALSPATLFMSADSDVADVYDAIKRHDIQYVKNNVHRLINKETALEWARQFSPFEREADDLIVILIKESMERN